MQIICSIALLHVERESLGSPMAKCHRHLRGLAASCEKRIYQHIAKLDVNRDAIEDVFWAHRACASLKGNQRSTKDQLPRSLIISLLICLFLATSAAAEQTTEFCQAFPDDPACSCPTNVTPPEIEPPEIEPPTILLGEPPGFGSGSPFIQTTFRSGNGMLQVAITPSNQPKSNLWFVYGHGNIHVRRRGAGSGPDGGYPWRSRG